MKWFLALFVIFSTAHCLIPSTETIWGDIDYGFNTWKYVKVFSLTQQPIDHTIKWPEDWFEEMSPTIVGIRYKELNTETPANVTFLEGGIGSSFVNMSISCSAGQSLHSSVYFHFIVSNNHNLDGFFEANINIDGLDDEQ